MLTGLSVENYRAFQKPTTINIAPITILLGANSSGKSSVTRLFPLLNQSLGVRTSAPILWVTEDLDYGSFADNVTRSNSNSPIIFSLHGSIAQEHISRVYPGLGSIQLRPSDIAYNISISGSEDRTILTRIQFNIYNETVTLHANEDGYIIKLEFRDTDYTSMIKDRRLGFVQGLFPTFYSHDKDGSATTSAIREFATEAARILRAYAHQNTSFQTINSATSSAYLGTLEQTFSSIKSSSHRISSLQRSIDWISEDYRCRVWLSFFLSSLNSITQSAQRALSPDITAGSYLAPVRASAERYYRRQELAVDRIDPSGGNVAMYLNSLGWGELEALNTDFLEFFDHTIQVKRGEGHISLRIGNKSGEYSDNLADVGFGFSQLLPIIAQIYAARRNVRVSSRLGFNHRTAAYPIIAVEQPELHLHPAYQSRLGMYFAKMAKRQVAGEPRFRFVIETHSEPLVNEIASLVGRCELNPDDVKIYLFDQHDDSEMTTVIEAEILPDGSIPKWPFGFFSSGRINRNMSSQ